MDVSAFSDENFDVKDWINKTFKSAEAQENRDAFVSSLVMKLQLYVQQINSAVEDTSHQVLQSLPRVMRDTELLLQEALSLHNMMQSVRQEIVKVEQDTGQSIASLERIDRIKCDLQAAREALHEADNWTVLASDLEEVFESGNIESISAKLVSMQQSLQVLASVPDYEDRKLQLEGLKNRLEAIASPLLVQAFTTGSLDQSRVFIRVFTSIDRLAQLLKYYHKCQKGALLQQWSHLVEEQDEGVQEWLHKFYDKLLSHWHEQVKWCGQVFSNPSSMHTLVALYADVLSSLEPSPNVCIDAALKQQSDQLRFLMELKQLTKHFAGNLQVAVESAVQGIITRSTVNRNRHQTYYPTVHDDDDDDDDENYGKGVEKGELLLLAQSVYSPYINHISKYATYEQQQLTRVSEGIVCTKDDLMDTIQTLGLSVPKAVSGAMDAAQRCQQFTEGCGYPGLLKSLKVFFTSYLDQFKSAQRRLNQQKREQEDWNLFQMCLTLLQNIGELLLQLKQLNSDLKHYIVDAITSVNGQEENPFSQFKQLLLTDAGRKELDALISNAKEEETHLLEAVVQQVNKLCSDVHHVTFQVILAPVTLQLQQVSTAPTWCNTNTSVTSELPDFSFAPQEYITQACMKIGQYLMTLPQHMEPFLLRDNPALAMALTVADAEYDASSSKGQTEGEGYADVLLGLVARGTCQTFCECILGIGELSPGGCKQLATDIDYLGNVLEDLGLALSEPLAQLALLLRVNPSEYHSKSSGSAPRLVAAVRQMRNITSS
ncbi:Conserved oligomeric Golgi complex subunit 7 [Gryllus bimaculatus]|nr:Conserved oligomeric Golgi complex subunit 7 [Gryllus bimaculatus]